jgi:hypothetical protein
MNWVVEDALNKHKVCVFRRVEVLIYVYFSLSRNNNINEWHNIPIIFLVTRKLRVAAGEIESCLYTLLSVPGIAE